jgi:hypothetical protein
MKATLFLNVVFVSIVMEQVLINVNTNVLPVLIEEVYCCDLSTFSPPSAPKKGCIVEYIFCRRKKRFNAGT